MDILPERKCQVGDNDFCAQEWGEGACCMWTRIDENDDMDGDWATGMSEAGFPTGEGSEFYQCMQESSIEYFGISNHTLYTMANFDAGIIWSGVCTYPGFDPSNPDILDGSILNRAALSLTALAVLALSTTF